MGGEGREARCPAMSPAEADRVREQICDAIVVTEFYPPPLRPLLAADGTRERVPSAELIDDAERRLGVALPTWLRRIYESCNGFATHTGECILYPFHGPSGVTEFTLFLREMEWQPSWISRAIVFGYVGGAGRARRRVGGVVLQRGRKRAADQSRPVRGVAANSVRLGSGRSGRGRRMSDCCHRALTPSARPAFPSSRGRASAESSGRGRRP